MLNNIETGVQKNLKSVNGYHAEEIKDQHAKLLAAKELEKRGKLIEEKNALQSNLEHLDKMERRYKNIFDVIEQKQSDIQKSYNTLGFGRNNLAKSEVDKDALINSFVDKQIKEYEVKVKNEHD